MPDCLITLVDQCEDYEGLLAMGHESKKRSDYLQRAADESKVAKLFEKN